MATASDLCGMWRLLGQQLVGPALDHPPRAVGSQVTALWVHHQPDVQAVVALAHPVGLVANLDEPLRAEPTGEEHWPGSQGKRVGRDDVAWRQLRQALATTLLGWGQAAQAGLDVLRGDRLLQDGQLTAASARPAKAPPPQAGLEPAVAVLGAAVVRWLTHGDDDGAAAEGQAEPADAR